ncbi:MAG: DUF2218 domain-containing protein [Sphingomicrobium sp.]
MTLSATAFTAAGVVPTSSGCRYLRQLCRYWSNDLDVEFTPEHRRARFAREV